MKEVEKLKKQLDLLDSKWGAFSCDCLGFLVRKIEKQIVEKSKNPTT